MQNESKMSALRNAASGGRAGLHGPICPQEADGISPKPREFLALLSIGGNPNETEPGATEQTGIFDALLLDGLDRGKFSDDGRLRTYVAGLAAATDRENEYERVSLEHQA